jgi:hypothetical protein
MEDKKVSAKMKPVKSAPVKKVAKAGKKADSGKNKNEKVEIIKVRAKKDPKAPKKARSAYTYYLEESHARIKVSNPDAPFGAISKQISAEWKAMSDAQKRRYEELSRQDKLRFSEEKSEYIPTPGYGADGNALFKKKVKHKRAKRGHCSAYIIFVIQMRPVIKGENPNIINTDIMKEAGNRWRAMTPQQKQPWEDLAAQDKARFEQEMAAHRMNA